MTPEQARKRAGNLMARYGITIEQYDALLAFQGGRCAICLKHPDELSRRLHVDHQHSPPYWIRGLLCFHCNAFVIGRKTDPEVFLRAGAYLQNPPGKALMPEHSVPHKPTPRRRRVKRADPA